MDAFLFGGKALVEGLRRRCWGALKKGILCGCLFCLGGKALVEGFKNWLVQGRRAVLKKASFVDAFFVWGQGLG